MLTELDYFSFCCFACSGLMHLVHDNFGHDSKVDSRTAVDENSSSVNDDAGNAFRDHSCFVIDPLNLMRFV